MENLHPSVIACSETQERFCWISPPEFSQTILDHYNKTWDLPSVSHNAGASIVGKINTSENYTIKYQ
jgi:phosphoribosylformylglycinamidine (FGAM) synthase-like enzyme